MNSVLKVINYIYSPGSLQPRLFLHSHIHMHHFPPLCIGSCCSKVHSDYITSKLGNICWLGDIQKDSRSASELFFDHIQTLGENLFVSFDIDAVSGCYAPGVSAVATVGLSSNDAIEIAQVSGRDPRVKLMDLSEFNPLIEDHRTGRLTASVFYYFCIGVAQRMDDKLR